MASPLIPCPACGCHAKRAEVDCPSCGAPLRRGDGTIPRAAAAILLGLVAATTGSVACGGSVVPSNGAGTTSAGSTGGAGTASAGNTGGAGGELGSSGAALYGIAETVSATSTGGGGGAGGAGGAGETGGTGGTGGWDAGCVAPPYGQPP